jgi:intein/homing endonuclease
LLTESQSEMLGILFGDGSMSMNHNSVQIVITGHKFDDVEYLIGRVGPMFAKLFEMPLKVHLVKDENTMILYAYSKRVALTLHEWGMPFGRKKLALLTPHVALDEVSFVRGLFDTDGCVYRKYGPYVQIQFKFASFSLLEYARECLVRLGLNPTSIRCDDTKFRFYLSRQAEVDRFFRVVEPKNPKHLNRFQNASRNRSYRPYTHRPEALRRIGNQPSLIGPILWKTHSVGQLRKPST